MDKSDLTRRMLDAEQRQARALIEMANAKNDGDSERYDLAYDKYVAITDKIEEIQRAIEEIES